MTTHTYRAFRLGDIRGLYPEEVNESFVAAYTHAFIGQFLPQGAVAVGRDMRDSSAPLQQAVMQTLASIGVDVIDIGLCPTELGYFASAQDGIGAAMVITASHNPPRYNGIKCVLSGGRAITFEDGLYAVRDRMLSEYRHPSARGSLRQENFHERYLAFLREHFPPERFGDGTVALNGLNGTAGSMAGMIASSFNLPVAWFREEPGPMPDQGADPVNPRLVKEMAAFMSGKAFTLGVAWDGDCDRCVCFDEHGQLIPTYYLIGLLAERFLKQNPAAGIVYDTKLCWNTEDVISQHGGTAIPAKTGHAFMKQKMHAHQAVYGGELSSHHYFGDFFGCDSGMFAWLTVLSLLHEGESIQSLINERRRKICCLPEISLSLSDPMKAFKTIARAYEDQAIKVDTLDGPSYTMPGNWRFSLRRSKTEPVVRLNFESRGGPDDLIQEAYAVLDHLEPWRAEDHPWPKTLYIQ